MQFRSKFSLLGVVCGAFVATLPTLDVAAQPLGEHVPRTCLYGVEGKCLPSYSTWGYYQPKWRPWPTEYSGPIRPPATYGTPPYANAKGLDVVVPGAEDEGNLRPELPGFSSESDDMGAGQAAPLDAPTNENLPTNENPLINPFRDDDIPGAGTARPAYPQPVAGEHHGPSSRAEIAASATRQAAGRQARLTPESVASQNPLRRVSALESLDLPSRRAPIRRADGIMEQDADESYAVAPAGYAVPAGYVAPRPQTSQSDTARRQPATIERMSTSRPTNRQTPANSAAAGRSRNPLR